MCVKLVVLRVRFVLFNRLSQHWIVVAVIIIKISLIQFFQCLIVSIVRKAVTQLSQSSLVSATSRLELGRKCFGSTN